MPMSSQELETQVQRELSANEPIDQNEFIESFSERSKLRQQDILGALRNLMEHNKVSYTIDYNLQTEDEL